MEDKYFKFSPSVILLPFFTVLLLWIVYWVELRFDFNFTHFGILPRSAEGLRGIVLSPFIHGNLEHLFNNSIPMLVLMAALRYFYRELTWKVLGYGILLSGLITWIIGRDSYHIGASGLIYVLVSFIFFKGILTKYYRLVALSLTIIVIYGGMIWYVFPGIEENVSWEGHLGGLISGFGFALFYQTPQFTRQPKYDWEFPGYDPAADKFMQRFDENGNFVNPPPPEALIENNDAEHFEHTSTSDFRVTYKFRERG